MALGLEKRDYEIRKKITCKMRAKTTGERVQ